MKEKQKRFLKGRKSFILLLTLCLGVGFALLSSNLTITGNTSVSGNKWNVYFTNVHETDGSVEASVVPTVEGTSTTELNYTVLLDKPGDFYEFTVDAVNNGTIDAMIQNVNMTSLDTDVAKYINYTATYKDGRELGSNNLLRKNSTVTYKVRVEFKTDISASDLNEEATNLSLTFGVNYVQSNINIDDSNFLKLVKNSALSDTNIDFTSISSEANGRGLYLRENTKVDAHPIYYYRGNVSNNNAKFAGFCWKIVRTTETGGTKLIYNGRPNETTGECDATGDATLLENNSAYNTNKNSPAYNGYMYGDNVYEYEFGSTSSSYIYGNTFTYENETYTLVDTHEGMDPTHHYTCLSSSTTCESVKYVYNYWDWAQKVHYITLTGGKDIDTALAEMQTNTNDSTVKAAIDDWFENTFNNYFTNSEDYKNYLEDTIWCNDRSMNTIDLDGTGTYTNNGWNPNGGSKSSYLYYSAYGRMKAGTPSLTCSNKNDSFTVEESATGNGALEYPVGLLTADEMSLAGGKLSADSNQDFYLYNNRSWRIMSPAFFRYDYSIGFAVSQLGSVIDYSIDGKIKVRPSISLKPGVKIAEGGDGTAATPYEFVVE